MHISEYSVKRPITTTMVIVSIIVLGLLALQRLPLTFFPEFQSVNLRVSVPYPSSSPQEVERFIAQPIEEAMGTLTHLDKIASTSSATGADIRLDFKDGTDMDLASVEVRDRLDRVRKDLPSDVERIFIRRWSTSDAPVFQFGIAWEGSKNELAELVEKVIAPRLQRIEGVANVELRGVDQKQVIVDLDQNLMRSYGIDAWNLSRSLRNNNLNISGGYVMDGGKKYTVRVMGEFQTIEEIADIPISGHNLTLKDLAEVRFDVPERDEYDRLNRRESISVRVYKASTANVVEVIQNVKAVLKEMQEEPQFKTVILQVFRDQSQDILTSLRNLTYAGIFGGVLASLILFLFLRKVRITLIISIAIPVSIICTFLFLYILRLNPFDSQVTINLVSLSGLMFAVGMLVDPAVVVVENIFRHKQEEGLSAKDAAITGAKEVGVAVMAATLTNIIVFIPVIFLQGSGMGRWMNDFGLAICTATVASLLIAVTLIPLASSRLFFGEEKPRAVMATKLGNGYQRVLRFALGHRLALFMVFIGILYGAWKMYGSIGRDWMPRSPERRMEVNVILPRSFDLEQARAVFDTVETVLMNRREELEIVTIASEVSTRRGELDIFFTPQEQAKKSTTELFDLVRQILPSIAGVEFKVGRMFGRGGDQMGVSINLKGPSTAALRVYGEEIRELIKDIEGIKDIQTSWELGDEEIQVTVDRERVERYGLSAEQVARTIASSLSSRATSKFKTSDKEVDILVQLKEEDRVNLQQLQNMPMAATPVVATNGATNGASEMVKLGTLARFRVQKGPQAIQREDRETTVTIVANTDRSSLWMVNEDIAGRMAQVQLPPGYSWDLGRNWMLMQQSAMEGQFSILLAIILIYIVMAALFESFVHPFTILFSIPFAVIGVILLFWATGTTLSNMGWLGLLVVCGLVVNNGIILIDYVNHLRRQGVSRSEALLRGGANRLRPILMTTLTTIIGLAPMVIPYLIPQIWGPQEGRTAMYAPVGIAVVGGLLTSTPLTLILMPILYSIVDDVGTWVKRVALASGQQR
jgi:HAE1 family hydrophobic/amphiphilic exporter-1